MPFISKFMGMKEEARRKAHNRVNLIPNIINFQGDLKLRMTTQERRGARKKI